MKIFAVEKNKKNSIYKSILQQKPTFYINLLKRSTENNVNINVSQNTRSYILNGFWKLVKIFDTMPPSGIIFCCWDKQGAEKQVSFRVWAKIKYLAVTC